MLCWIAKPISGEDSTPLMILGHRKCKYSLVFKNKLKQIGLKVKYEDFSHVWLVVLDASSRKNEGCLIVQCSSILRNVLGIHPSKQGDNSKEKTSRNYEERKAQNTHRLYKRDYNIEELELGSGTQQGTRELGPNVAAAARAPG